jgi:hypothetical protein
MYAVRKELRCSAEHGSAAQAEAAIPKSASRTHRLAPERAQREGGLS